MDGTFSSAVDAKQIFAAFQAQLTDLGVAVTDTGSVVSHNHGTDGDAEYEANFVMNSIHGTARMTYVPVGGVAAIVFSIDQSNQ